jgi:hypothetical protein
MPTTVYIHHEAQSRTTQQSHRFGLHFAQISGRQITIVQHPFGPMAEQDVHQFVEARFVGHRVDRVDRDGTVTGESETVALRASNGASVTSSITAVAPAGAAIPSEPLGMATFELC